MTTTFSERFCQQHRLPPDRFRAALLRRTLYPAARWLHPLLTLVDRDYFAVDYSYIDSVGQLRRLRDFPQESQEFTHDPRNRLFLRRTLRLRVSIGRMQDVVNHVFNDTVAS